MVVGLASLLTVAAARGDREVPSDEKKNSPRLWASLIQQATRGGLPTRFLRAIDPQFPSIDFEDLHTYAAEYHPRERRIVLNRSLSFNAAGGVLRSLSGLDHRDLGTLYHELFHVYLDYLGTVSDRALPEADRRVAIAAREYRRCRYEAVVITPIVQRKGDTEMRYLTEGESWEALNETWAVFVGWAVWSALEVSADRPRGRTNRDRRTAYRAWLDRLKQADSAGELVGYYEPEDAGERAIAQKRYLAPSHRISGPELSLLLEGVLDRTPEEARMASDLMDRGGSIAHCVSPTEAPAGARKSR